MINNSSDMKTIVETYIQEETAELIYDNEKLDEWNDKIRDLGLKGQANIVRGEKSPIPFLYMKDGLVQIFKTLCPAFDDIENYSKSPIPLEILSLVAMSKDEEYFTRIEIWYDDKSPDPVCVGITGGYKYYGDNTLFKNKLFRSKEEANAQGCTESLYFNETGKYLIGRWGDVKRSFEQLKDMAIKRFTAERTAEINQQMRNLKRELEDMKDAVVSKFN